MDIQIDKINPKYMSEVIRTLIYIGRHFADYPEKRQGVLWQSHTDMLVSSIALNISINSQQ